MKILKPNLALVLDTRRAKQSLRYPVKLRITFNRSQRYYSIGIDLTENEFELIQNVAQIKAIKDLREKRSLQENKLKCDLLYAKAYDILIDLKVFSFTSFEKQFFGKQELTNDLVYPFFQTIIDKIQLEGRLGTASNYACSLKSLETFKPNLKFRDVSADFLKKYENWLLEDGKSISTVGIYLRPFRAVLNLAIAEGLITKEDSYPFGKGHYQIPATRNVKKALSKDEIKLIYDYNGPKDSWWAKARDFFLFSYLANGMNMKDILLLRRKDIDGNHIRFIRAKTKNTNRSNIKPISIFISPELRTIINTWQSKNLKDDDYLFPFLDKNSTAEKLKADIQQFIKMVNKYLRNITAKQGIDKRVTTYHARHSFATILKRSGVSTEVISESLGHTNIHTTANYLDSFDDETMKNISVLLL